MTISQDPSAPLVAVVGATGNQGGSVIRHLEASPKPYRIRGFTRDTSKSSAQELSTKGVEMMAVSLTVESSNAVFQAHQGVNIAFEIAEGKLLVDAAKAAGVELFIWSGLVDAVGVSNGKFVHADHLDSKAVVTAYAKEVTKSGGMRFINVMAGLYMTNFSIPSIATPKKEHDGTFVLKLPVPADGVAPVIDTARDYGLFVRRAIEGSYENGQDVYAYGEIISYGDMAKQMSEITGKHVSYKQISQEEYIAMDVASGKPERIALELSEMYLEIHEFGYFGVKDIGGCREGLGGATFSWADFVKATDWSEILN
ncbi:hypothetical protein FRB96_004447 [Tulasnella sp. 330]|nr:hypothetical protein FRB96_004447 [Tulasnella sp. 330]KAG8867233.1 hypothetical protein FRB97_003431 [Tulasnella sp. 331]